MVPVVRPVTLMLLPDVGDWLRLSPQYNAATLVEIARHLGAAELLWLTDPDPEHPARDALLAAGLRLVDLAPDWRWAQAEAGQLQTFLGQYPAGRERLRTAGQLEAELARALSRPLTPRRVTDPELLGAVRAYHAGMAGLFGEGPGTVHRARRLDVLREVLAGQSGLALVSLDDLPDLLDSLPNAALPDLMGFIPGERSRLRALTDRAERLEEGDDLQGTVDALLREGGDEVTPKAELQYAAAGAYLAVGDLESARELLESAAHALTDHPRTLPGLVLARLGQVRDAQGERDLALRAYSAVLALPFAPQAALEAAGQGQRAPFTLEAGE